jgi:hypothetical protein
MVKRKSGASESSVTATFFFHSRERGRLVVKHDAVPMLPYVPETEEPKYGG